MKVSIPNDHPDYLIWLEMSAAETAVCSALQLAESGSGYALVGGNDDRDSDADDEGEDLSPEERAERKWRSIANTIERKFKTKYGCHYADMRVRLCDKWGMQAPYRFLGYVGIK